MPRFLVKENARTIDVAKVPKGAKIQKKKGAVRVKTKTKTGVWLKGYKVKRGKSLRDFGRY